jgi:hypothetical protein
MGCYGTARLGSTIHAIAPVLEVNSQSWNKGFELLMGFSLSLECVSLVALRDRSIFKTEIQNPVIARTGLR